MEQQPLMEEGEVNPNPLINVTKKKTLSKKSSSKDAPKKFAGKDGEKTKKKR